MKVMKMIYIKVASLWAHLFLFPFKLIFKAYGKEKVIEELMIQICRILEKGTSVFVSHRLRPVKPQLPPDMPKVNKAGSVAVILQGPVMHENDFTLNTVRYYNKLSGDIRIIVSTWSTESDDTVRDLENAGAIVIQSKPLSFGGVGNINNQLATMQAGIEKAIEIKADFICKSRTDQRIEHPYAFAYMQNLLKQHPVAEDSKLQNRIVAFAMEYGSIFEPFYISDFLYFGCAQDMKMMLQIPFDERRKIDRPNLTRRMLAEQKGNAEIYIVKSFFEACGEVYDNSILGYWTLLKNSMILIDKPMIRLYWPKYDARYCDHVRDGSYTTRMVSERNGLANFDFLSWLSLKNGELLYDKSYEKYLDLLM